MWEMQTAPLPMGGAYAKAEEKVRAKDREMIRQLDEGVQNWKKKAVNIQAIYDSMTVSAMSWKNTAEDLRDQFAPKLTDADLRNKYNQFEPVNTKKYYNENVRARTWDK